MTRAGAGALVVMALLAGLGLRLARLDVQPMHNDEANQAVKFGELLETGAPAYKSLFETIAASEDGVLWNHVDSVFDGPEHARTIMRAGLSALGRERPALPLAWVVPFIRSGTYTKTSTGRSGP